MVLRVLVDAVEPFRPLLPMLAALLGALVAWFAVHHVANQTAKRAAYGAYIGAAELYANDMIRWVETNRRGLPTGDLIRPTEINAALGAVLLIAPKGTAELFHESQERLQAMRKASVWDQGWDPAIDSWRITRRRLINQARKETGTKSLPDRFFGQESPPGDIPEKQSLIN
jgi:hypothetical protein